MCVWFRRRVMKYTVRRISLSFLSLRKSSHNKAAYRDSFILTSHSLSKKFSKKKTYLFDQRHRRQR